MNSEEFRRAVHIGLGRAILYASSNDVSLFREIILDACLRCCAFDVQMEGTRAPFMYELIGLTAERGYYRERIIASLASVEDDWDAVQRFRLASYFAMDGDEVARNAMYERFEVGSFAPEHTAMDFVRMDGIEGLLFAAGKLSDCVDGEWVLSTAIKQLGEQETMSALQEAGKSNPRVEAFRVAALASREQFKSAERGSCKRPVPPTADELRHAADSLLSATTVEEQHRLLRLFRDHPFPLGAEPLFAFTRSEDLFVSRQAFRALSRLSDPSIRALALQLIDTGHDERDRAIDLLIENFCPGDHDLALSWFANENDDVARHGLGMGLRRLWEHRPESESEVRMLLTIYELGPCSVCRDYAVHRLIELSALTPDLRKECAFDANEDIRELVGA